ASLATVWSKASKNRSVALGLERPMYSAISSRSIRARARRATLMPHPEVADGVLELVVLAPPGPGESTEQLGRCRGPPTACDRSPDGPSAPDPRGSTGGCTRWRCCTRLRPPAPARRFSLPVAGRYS